MLFRSLRDYEPMVMNRIAQLCEQFDAREGKVFDLNEFMGYLVFDGKASHPRARVEKRADAAPQSLLTWLTEVKPFLRA